jgi:hypothetical protein
MTAPFKPLPLLIKEKDIRNPEEVKKIWQGFEKYKKRADELWEKTLEYRKHFNPKVRERLLKEFDKIYEDLEREKYGELYKTALNYQLGALIFPALYFKKRVHVSMSLTLPFPSINLPEFDISFLLWNKNKEIEKTYNVLKSFLRAYKMPIYKPKITVYNNEREFYLRYTEGDKEKAKKLQRNIPILGAFSEFEIIINLPGIKREYGRDWKRGFRIVLAHELLHQYPGFSEDMEIMNDAICETLAHKALKENFLTPYSRLMSYVYSRAAGVLGEERLLGSFF